jgi:hypothetical protein
MPFMTFPGCSQFGDQSVVDPQGTSVALWNAPYFSNVRDTGCFEDRPF